MRPRRCFAGAALVAACWGLRFAPPLAAQTTPPVDFARQIRPILSDACFTCHGPDEAKRDSDLRLDLKDSAFAEHNGKRVIAPGQPEASELIRRLTTADADERMPPADSGRALTAAEIELLKQWIAQGAAWKEHWAFVPPRRPPAPAVKQPAWARNAIDLFVLERLEREGLAPSAEAAKETLLRRVTLDLTGLPPTLAEVDAFVADASPDAYERAVDRLLASPRHGEHFAATWLDAARYGDTNGYQTDATRTMWPWRDWVIEALNEGQPFDQFTLEQLAGDLLPSPTTRQRLATGFHRNHPLNGEGGRIAEESRVEYVVDRVETTGAVWLGMTLGCGRCHDHKYDPFSQTEFYSFFAFFNNIAEVGNVDRGGNAAPVMKIATAEQTRRLDALNALLADLREQQQRPVDAARLAAWEQAARAQLLAAGPTRAWRPLAPITHVSERQATLSAQDDHVVFVGGANPDNDNYTLTLRLAGGEALAGKITGLRLEALAHDSFTQGGLARSDSGNFVLTTIELAAAAGTDAAPAPVRFAAALADFEQQGFPAKNAIDDDPRSGWAVHHPPNMKLNRAAVFTLAEPLAASADTVFTVRLKHESPHKAHNLGRFRLSVTTAAKPSLADDKLVPDDVAAALRLEAAARSPEQRQRLERHYREAAPEAVEQARRVSQTQGELDQLNKSLVETMVLEERPQPRDTFVLVRGQYDKPDKSKPARPAAPTGWSAWPQDAPPNRLGLARWLVEGNHPLTARVVANRQWQQLLGAGLVRTSEDFGSQGEPPTHPELLDWLAVELRESGWDLKRLTRAIVTSATYRQSSRVTEELARRDPDNRWHARAPRRRLTSLALRDQALAVSGLLVEQVGGPPVKPYQPDGVWEDFSLGKISYQRDSGEKLYRRSVYTFWRRSVSPTMFFDASARQVCVVRPSLTNSPLHALTLLNDVTYAEAARKMAERVLREGGTTAEARLEFAFRLVTARRPSAAEASVLRGAWQRAQSHYANQPRAAQELLGVGESPADPSLAPGELAAAAAVMNMLLNLDETLNRE